MASGPWEKYGSQNSVPAGPWQKYAPAASAEYVQPAPPPGEIIHGADRSYVSDRPGINTVRDSGASEDAVMGALRMREKTNDAGASLSAPVLQGLTFNTGDEIISGAMSLLGLVTGQNPADTFEFNQEIQRQELARQRENNPIATAVAEIGGGLASGVGLANNGVTLVGRIANEGVRNILPRAAAGAAEGAAYAGLAGFAGADGGVDNRAQQAVENIPLGAAVGGAAVPAADLVSAVLGRVGNVFAARNDPQGRADRLIVERMAQDSQTPDQIAQAVEAARGAGQPDYRAVDAAGRNVQRIGAMAAKTPGEARNDISQTLAARQGAQGERIGNYLDEALGAQGPNAFATEQGIADARATAAQPLYDAAYAASAPEGDFYTSMLSRQSVMDAMPAAERVAAERQTPITDLFTEVLNPNPTLDAPTMRIPTVRGWDFIKRELDAKVNQLYRSGDTTAAEAIEETRNALRAQLSGDVPEYGQALANYSDKSSALDAIQLGRGLANARNADEARAALAEIPEAQRDLPRIGAAREFGVKLEAMRGGQDKTLLFDTPNMQGKLDALIEDPTLRALFGERLGREQDMVRAGRAMTGGSSTYENLADGQQLNDAGGVMAALLSGQFGRAIGLAGGQALGSISRGALGMNEDVANRVGQYLMSADPQEIRSLADLFRQVQNEAYQPSRIPSVVSAGFNAPRTGSGDKRKER